MQEKSVKFEKDKTVNIHASKTNLDKNLRQNLTGEKLFSSESTLEVERRRWKPWSFQQQHIHASVCTGWPQINTGWLYNLIFDNSVKSVQNLLCLFDGQNPKVH